MIRILQVVNEYTSRWVGNDADIMVDIHSLSKCFRIQEPAAEIRVF